MLPFHPLGVARRLLPARLAFSSLASAQPNAGEFRRVATYPVFQNRCALADEACIGEETVAESVAVSTDGKTLVYTDSPNEEIGFVDISNLASPVGRGVLAMGGEPTSVAVWNQYALVAVNTSPSFTAPSGHIAVVEIATRRIRQRIDVGGQPDAIAVSRDGRYAAVAIENERNEALCIGGTGNGEEVSSSVCRAGGGALGAPGQAPAGFLTIVDTVGAPAGWRTRRVSMTGLAEKFPQDPEPEFVDINALNQAVVTLQ